MITAGDLEGANVVRDCFYNMGDKGTGYGYRFERWPRLRIIERSWRATRQDPQGHLTRSWVVDGVEYGDDQEAALAALNAPPSFTLAEREALDLFPVDFSPFQVVLDKIAGCRAPAGPTVPDTPHARAYFLAACLHDKGAIEFREAPDPLINGDFLRVEPVVRKVLNPR